MKKALIVTLGFDERFCYRAILRHGIREGDIVILITARLIDRVRKAYDLVNSFMRTSFGDSVKIELIELEIEDIESSTVKIMKLLDSLRDYEVIINLSGGMRTIILTIIFATLLASIDARIELELEDGSNVIEIPKVLINIPRIISILTDEKLEILKSLHGGIKNSRDLAKKLGKDESTVRRHLAELIALDLVKSIKRKPLIVKTSKLVEGIIFLTESD